jgi:DnaJ-class molecular chaperone
MSRKCLYQILNVCKTANQDDIRKAFRKLALLHHPDKNPNHDDAFFKEIKDAYDILSDPVKRQFYDLTSQTTSGFQNEDMNWMDMMTNIAACLKAMYERYKTEKDNVITIHVNVTLEDIYHRKIKKIVVNTLNSDKSVKPTPIYISLMNYQEEYRFHGVGDEFEIPIPLVPGKRVKTRGDVIIKVAIDEHPTFKIDTLLTPFDLHVEKKVSLYQYLYGDTFELDLFGESVSIEYTNGCKVKVLKEKGLPYYDEEVDKELRGDVYVFFDVVLPTNFQEFTQDDNLRNLVKNYMSVL